MGGAEGQKKNILFSDLDISLRMFTVLGSCDVTQIPQKLWEHFNPGKQARFYANSLSPAFNPV